MLTRLTLETVLYSITTIYFFIDFCTVNGFMVHPVFMWLRCCVTIRGFILALGIILWCSFFLAICIVILCDSCPLTSRSARVRNIRSRPWLSFLVKWLGVWSYPYICYKEVFRLPRLFLSHFLPPPLLLLFFFIKYFFSNEWTQSVKL